AALAIYHRTLPPTLKVRRPSPVLEHRDSPFYLAPRKRPWWTGGRPRRAGVSAFGFGGSNFHCILEQHGDSCPDPDWDARIEIFALSGETPQALREKLEALESTDAKATRASFDARQPHRLVFVWRHGEDFEARRAEARES